MAANAPETLLTAEEFYELPELADACRMELVDGRVIMTPPPGFEHADASGEIIARIRMFARAHKLGRGISEAGFRLRSDPDVVREPDAAFISFARLSEDQTPRGYVSGTPDLAVEVVSPHDSPRHILEKVGDYLDAGAERGWVVRPATRTVTVYYADGDVTTLRSGETLTSAHAAFAADGFELPIDEIFA
jgi:Uma2 family endonuclease